MLKYPTFFFLFIAGFRALVEENVKASVARIAQDTIITKVRLFYLYDPGGKSSASYADGIV